MSTIFIILFILAIITALLGLTGLIILINGMINKNNKQTLRGGILTGIALILVIIAVFFSARKVVHFIKYKSEEKKEFRHHCCQMKDMCKDSLMDHKCMGMKDNDDTTKSKPSCCSHHQKK